MPVSSDTRLTTQSRVLAALTQEEQTGLLPKLEKVFLTLGEIIYEPRRCMDYFYFLDSCIVSLDYTTSSGATVQIALVGNEGVAGLALFLGGATMPHRAVVLVAGDAFRIKAKALYEAVECSSPLRRLLLQYTQALLTQISQAAVCNRLHSVDQRLCHWILMCHDRLQSDELLMTQECISNILGGGRQSITCSAGCLQDAGFIHYTRGHITIVDRAGLEAAACECYSVVKAEVDRLMGVRQPLRLRSAPNR